MRQVGAVMLTATLVAGCATGSAVRRGNAAVKRGDFDAAVEYYRDALGRDPGRADVKIWLARAIQSAAAEHIKRARELEAEGQIGAAIIEYRKAAELDPAGSLARQKATDLTRRLRTDAEAARAPSQMATLQQQAAQTSTIPRLDPRIRVPVMRYTQTSVRDLLRTVSDLTGLNIQYDTSANSALSQADTIDVQDASLEEVLFQILQKFTLTYKVINSRSILVYQDTQPNRQKFEDQYVQTFYLSNAVPQDVQNQLNQLLAGVTISNRPSFSQNASSNSLTVRGTAPMLQMLGDIIKSVDKPVAEVFIEGEILEVSRSFVRQLGLDLSQWALGFTLSPEVVPPNTSGTIPPANPPPFSLTSMRPAPGAGDIYLTAPTMVIKLLESNSSTKVLARPSQRGRAGQQIRLTLGDQVPIPQTVFSSAAAGGLNNIPTTQVQYQSVGVNLLFTPKVTYNDEIILEALTLEKSGLGANLDIGGQTFPTIVSRSAVTAIGLRDGESTLIAGLLRDDDRKTYRALPGISRIPVLNQIFGNSDRQIEQTEIIMIITAHIVRGHELTLEDLQPRFIGAGTNIGAGTQQLLVGDALLGGAAAVAGAAPAAGPGGLVQSAIGNTPDAGAGAAAPVASRAPGVVPIQPVTSGASAPNQPPGQARITIAAPSAGADGTIPAGGGPFTMPIQISGVQNVAAVALTISYNPAVITNVMAGQGTFMTQNGVTPTFNSSVSAGTGRVEMAFSRPGAQPGASGSGVLGAISFTAGAPGATDVVITGVATTTTGQSVPLQFTNARITVK